MRVTRRTRDLLSSWKPQHQHQGDLLSMQILGPSPNPHGAENYGNGLSTAICVLTTVQTGHPVILSGLTTTAALDQGFVSEDQ